MSTARLTAVKFSDPPEYVPVSAPASFHVSSPTALPNRNAPANAPRAVPATAIPNATSMAPPAFRRSARLTARSSHTMARSVTVPVTAW